jgi:hypothetical protein
MLGQPCHYSDQGTDSTTGELQFNSQQRQEISLFSETSGRFWGILMVTASSVIGDKAAGE